MTLSQPIVPRHDMFPSGGVSLAHDRRFPSPCGLLEDALALFHRHGRTDEAFQAIGDQLRRFATQAGLATLIDRAGKAGGVRLLAETLDGTVTLTLERLSPSQALPLPDQAAWSIAVVVRGRVRYLTWEQSRQATNGEARRIARELELTTGDFVYFPDSPGERHGRQATGADVWELRLTGTGLDSTIASAA